MSNDIKRSTFRVSAAFYEAVEGYRKEQGLKSWSAALLTLAQRGYKAETGKDAPEASGNWGGPRTVKSNE